MPEKPKIYKNKRTIPYGGHLTITFEGEDWGQGIQDTIVRIESGTLCFITWDNRDNFLRELFQVLEKYKN